jgi:hypothetical protein
MKVSLRQLKKCISQIERESIYDTSSSIDDTIVEINISEGDPGNSKLMSSLIMSASASDLFLEKSKIIYASSKVELFEKHEKMEPIVDISFSKKII